jgi:iron uptake system component EfeO
MQKALVLASILALGSVACGGSDDEEEKPELTDEQHEEKILSGMHASVLSEIQTLRQASSDICAAAPAPVGQGWDESADAAALDATKAAWIQARSAYERTEGVIAPLFPDTDYAIDARYDDYLLDLGAAGDPNPFDGEGVTGMHGMERVLWANEIPALVVEFEATLPGYAAAAWPATETEAGEFKTGLCQRMVEDVTALEGAWEPADLHINIAFQGLISLMAEQREKVVKAASDEEESRYSQRTMADIRDNLQGTKDIYAIFRDYIRSKENGTTLDANILAGFATLEAAYAKVPGDAFPLPPATWSSENPTPADLATPFGELYKTVDDAADPNNEASIVTQMNEAADLLGFGVI